MCRLPPPRPAGAAGDFHRACQRPAAAHPGHRAGRWWVVVVVVCVWGGAQPCPALYLHSIGPAERSLPAHLMMRVRCGASTFCLLACLPAGRDGRRLCSSPAAAGCQARPCGARRHCALQRGVQVWMSRRVGGRLGVDGCGRGGDGDGDGTGWGSGRRPAAPAAGHTRLFREGPPLHPCTPGASAAAASST